MMPRQTSIRPPSIHTDTMSDGQPGSATPKNSRRIDQVDGRQPTRSAADGQPEIEDEDQRRSLNDVTELTSSGDLAAEAVGGRAAACFVTIVTAPARSR